jgi:hypothetical protein
MGPVPPPDLVTVKLVSGVAPTIPPKVVVPAVDTVRFLAPLRVEAKLISPALPVPVLVNVASLPRVTAPVYVCVPEVVMLPANVDVPLTVKLDVPDVLVMLLPVAIDKLAMV